MWKPAKHVNSNLFPCLLGINYGKLMERILWFREQKIRFADDLMPYAEKCLTQIDMAPRDELRIAVLGDASGSMEVRTTSFSLFIVGKCFFFKFLSEMITCQWECAGIWCSTSHELPCSAIPVAVWGMETCAATFLAHFCNLACLLLEASIAESTQQANYWWLLWDAGGKYPLLEFCKAPFLDLNYFLLLCSACSRFGCTVGIH